MTPAQQTALETVAGRPLTPQEYVDIDALLPGRNDVAIAAILSVGRLRLVSHEIGERGILDALGSVAGDAFLSALEAIAAPADLPAPLQPHYGAIRRGVAWLKKDGLDVGSQTTRQLLDGLAAVGLVDAGSVTAVKSLAETADPIHYNAVSDALNIAEGRLML